MITATRYHDISCGHRVHGHESKCAHLHGHNYRIHFTCRCLALDKVGRVLDFSVMKSKLCMWLEENWDHRFLAWEDDWIMRSIRDIVFADNDCEEHQTLSGSLVWVPFNPTAENMAQYLLDEIGPQQLAGTGVELIEVTVEETMKCKATASL